MPRIKPSALIASLCTVTALAGCSEIQTSDADQTFRHWAGGNPPADMQIINGEYWESAHWTKEYIMYLEFKPTEAWWNEFLKINNIREDTDQWTMPGDAPTWFTPSGNATRYRTDGPFDQGSRYFRDPDTGICHIYEIQL